MSIEPQHILETGIPFSTAGRLLSHRQIILCLQCVECLVQVAGIARGHTKRPTVAFLNNCKTPLHACCASRPISTPRPRCRRPRSPRATLPLLSARSKWSRLGVPSFPTFSDSGSWRACCSRCRGSGRGIGGGRARGTAGDSTARTHGTWLAFHRLPLRRLPLRPRT